MTDSYAFYKDQLNGKYREVFDKVEIYVGTEHIDELTREEQLSQLLDMLLSAQTSGKPVEKITGNNLEQFCRAFCSEHGWKSRMLNIMDFLKTQSWIMLFFGAMDILPTLVDCMEGNVPAEEIWNMIMGINLSGYLVGIIIAMISGVTSSVVVRWAMFRTKRVSMNVLKVITAVVVAVAYTATILTLAWDKVDMIFCPAWFVLLASAVYLAVYYWMNRQRLSQKRSQKIRFSDMVDAETDKIFPAEMEKKYKKANNRSIKRGNGPLSVEDFLTREERECHRSENLKWLYYLFPLVITVWSALTIEFETWADLLILSALDLGIGYAIMLFFWKQEKKNVVRRRRWIQEKRELLKKAD